jgi:microcystin-dependent protein
MAVEWTDGGVPYLSNESLIGDVPEYTQLLMTGGATPVGAVTAYGGTAAPEGWLLCRGGLISKTNYPKLWEAIGYAYGGSGDDFGIPDLRGRVVAGVDAGASRLQKSSDPNQGLPNWEGAGDPNVIGSGCGNQRHALSISQMPSHTHGFGDTHVSNNGGQYMWPQGPAQPGASSIYGQVGSWDVNQSGQKVRGDFISSTIHAAGNGYNHPNVQPTLLLEYIIKHDYPKA